MSSTVSNFKRKRGISLEMLQWKRASSRDDGRTLWFFSSCFGILDLRRGTQDASRVCPGKSHLHSCCEGELGIALESLQGKWTSSRLVSRNSVFVSSYNRELGVEFKVHMRSQSSSRVQTKNSALFSSCDGYFLEPFECPKWCQASCGAWREDSGLLSMPFRKGRASCCDDCGISCFFLSCSVTCGDSLNLRRGFREPLAWPQGSPVSIRDVRGSAALFSSHVRGIGPQNTLKQES